MKLKEVDQEAMSVLAHVLASIMPDVLDKKRLDRWLEFAKGVDELFVDAEDDDYNLSISSVCHVLQVEGEMREVEIVNPTTLIYTPELGRIIGNKSIILNFCHDNIEVSYAGSPIFTIHYDFLPMLEIHALQVNPGNRTITSKGIRP